MSRFTDAISKYLPGASQKDTIPVNSYEGFQSNGAIVMRDRRGLRFAVGPRSQIKF